jgi:hypothetical protein
MLYNMITWSVKITLFNVFLQGKFFILIAVYIYVLKYIMAKQKLIFFFKISNSIFI